MWLKLISFASNLRCCLSWEVPTLSVDLHRHAWLSHAIQALQDCSLRLWNQSDKYGRLYSSMRQKTSWWTHPNLASIGNITAGNRDIAQCSKPEGIRDLCKLQPCESCYWGQKSPQPRSIAQSVCNTHTKKQNNYVYTQHYPLPPTKITTKTIYSIIYHLLYTAFCPFFWWGNNKGDSSNTLSKPNLERPGSQSPTPWPLQRNRGWMGPMDFYGRGFYKWAIWK